LSEDEDNPISSESQERSQTEAITSRQELLPPDTNERLRPSEEVLQQLVDVEKSRIASADKRTDVIKFAIQSNDDSDKRQFEFRMAQLQSAERDSSRKDRLAARILIVIASSGCVLLACLMAAVFFGSEKQSTIALDLLKALFTGVGGYGVINTIRRFTKGLLDKNSSNPH